MKRIYSIDVLRGIVMILMALDHVRDMMHTTSIVFQPTDLSKTTTALFFTRWVTHLCAPTFVFLSGTSAFLSMKKTNDLRATKRFLLTRGLWLIFLEFTLVNFALWFDIHFSLFLFDVIAAIGFGFIILSLLVGCSLRTIAIIGLAIIFLHNLAPFIPGSETSVFKTIAMPFFAPAAFPFADGKLFIVGYPPLPWLGIMLVGFAAGSLIIRDAEKRRKNLLMLGLCSIALFVVLRLINVYGDTFPWSEQKNALFSFLSFINVTKYPPSLDFCLLFLGIMFVLLYALMAIKNKWTGIAAVYGKVPLFYFIVHFYIIHLLVFVMIYLQGFSSADMVFGFSFGRPKSGSGLPLWAIYLVWIAVVALMYPLCRRYGSYKEQHREKLWLRYL